MRSRNVSAIVLTTAGLGALTGLGLAARDKYSLKVPNRLDLADFK